MIVVPRHYLGIFTLGSANARIVLSFSSQTVDLTSQGVQLKTTAVHVCSPGAELAPMNYDRHDQDEYCGRDLGDAQQAFGDVHHDSKRAEEGEDNKENGRKGNCP